ncbi:MAG: alkylated DNA repair dioxygenase AlkB [Bradymonadia bacterium]|jgi:alkylated DNA repair dioxygenase AlkB
MMGRKVEVPRWQQAFGQDYRFAGNISEAASVPDEFAIFLEWAQSEIDPRMNGLLVNWYDSALGHYIGKHRDKADDLVKDLPIVSISLGASRTFRMRPWRGKGFQDFPVHDGMYVSIPSETNKHWTHEVPLLTSRHGRRISVTIRAFALGDVQEIATSAA